MKAVNYNSRKNSIIDIVQVLDKPLVVNFFIASPNPPGNYILKVNNTNTRRMVWNMFKVNNKDARTTVMTSPLLLT